MVRDLQINVTFLYLLKTSFPQKSLNSVRFVKIVAGKKRLLKKIAANFLILAVFDICDIQCKSEKISVRIESV